MESWEDIWQGSMDALEEKDQGIIERLLSGGVLGKVQQATTAAQVAGNGANSEAIASGDAFGKGITIYGRWTACTLASGTVVVYYGK